MGHGIRIGHGQRGIGDDHRGGDRRTQRRATLARGGRAAPGRSRGGGGGHALAAIPRGGTRKRRGDGDLGTAQPRSERLGTWVTLWTEHMGDTFWV